MAKTARINRSLGRAPVLTQDQDQETGGRLIRQDRSREVKLVVQKLATPIWVIFSSRDDRYRDRNTSLASMGAWPMHIAAILETPGTLAVLIVTTMTV